MNTKLITVFNIVPKNPCVIWTDANEVANLLGQEGMVRLLQANAVNMSDDKYTEMLTDIAINIVSANQLDKFLAESLDKETIENVTKNGNSVVSTKLSSTVAPGFDSNKRVEKTRLEISQTNGTEETDDDAVSVEVALDGLAVELVTNQLSALVDKYYEQLDEDAKNALASLIDVDKAEIRFDLNTGRLSVFIKHEGFGLPKVEIGELTEELEEEEEDDAYEEELSDEDDNDDDDE